MLANEIIWGAEAIADYCAVKPRKVYEWAVKRDKGVKAPPIRSEGRKLYALRSQLNSHFSGEQ